MCTTQKYGANVGPATSALPTVRQFPSAVNQAASLVKPAGSFFPRWTPLIDYFDNVVYPYLLGGTAPIFTPDELAIHLLQVFEGRVGVADYGAWVWSYCAEVIYLFNLLGETSTCALLTLRGPVVSAALHELYTRQQSLNGTDVPENG